MKVPMGNEWKPCRCGMNACCGECLREERRRHLTILWLVMVLVVLAVVTGLLLGGVTS